MDAAHCIVEVEAQDGTFYRRSMDVRTACEEIHDLLLNGATVNLAIGGNSNHLTHHASRDA